MPDYINARELPAVAICILFWEGVENNCRIGKLAGKADIVSVVKTSAGLIRLIWRSSDVFSDGACILARFRSIVAQGLTD